MIVMISGKQAGGKTTLVENLSTQFNEFGSIKFAKPLYKIQDLVYEYLGRYGVPYQEKDGAFLQFIGEHFRNKHSLDIWVDIAKQYIDDLSENNPRALICIDDCRHMNEFDSLRKALKIRLECPEDIRKIRSPHWRDNTTHPSEVGLDAYSRAGKFDFYISTEIRSTKETFDMAMKAIDEYQKMGMVDSNGDYSLIFGTCI